MCFLWFMFYCVLRHFYGNGSGVISFMTSTEVMSFQSMTSSIGLKPSMTSSIGLNLGTSGYP